MTEQKFIKISNDFFVDADFELSFRKLGLTSIESVFAFDTAKNLTKKNLASFRSRLQFEISSPRSTTLFLKRYDNPPITVQLKNWFSGRGRKSLGFLEYETSEKLRRAGINTPKTIAYGQQWNSIFEKRSFFITEKIPDAEAIERKLPDCFQGKPAPENLRLRRKFISNLAKFIKKFHETNYRHRDLYLSHIFYSNKDDFYLIDLARAFRPFILKRRFQIKDIAQLYYSAPGKHFSRTDRMRFYLDYTGRRKLNPDDKIFIFQVIKKVNRIHKHGIRHDRQSPFAN
ncbi:MAG: hypothetical protein JW787_11650 [Sedimentisphaerales bacterium]|nr:hypothetical protein [Sedimentisphaerales bacterium]